MQAALHRRLMPGLIGVLVCAVMLLVGLVQPVVAAEGARIALVIGNKNYAAAVGPLGNPLNDIDKVGQALAQIGFEVFFLRDADFGTMQKAVKRHASRLQQAGEGAIGFFYYSGHGAMNEATRTNYLIPVDVQNTDTSELWDNSVRLETVIGELRDRASNATHFIVFDGCRNNLKLTVPGGKGTPIQSKGFRAERLVRGMLIAYATAEGEIASDIGEGAGPYASVLAEEIKRGGIEAVSMFRRVQLRVAAIAAQEPWLTYGTLPEIYLGGQGGGATAGPSATVAPPLSEAAKAWSAIDGTKNTALLEAFIAQYPGTVQAIFAGDQLQALRAQMASLPKPEETASTATNYRPGQTFRDCDICPEMVVVPAGEFMMGSGDGSADEQPVHKVAIAQPFAVGKFEVTFDEWDACVAAGGCAEKPEDKRWGRGRRPVINVSWHDAVAFATWLALNTGKPYRLLSEAEWEYAARAGSTADYTFGGDQRLLGQWAWYSGNSGRKTHPVGERRANKWGLYDMHGNVWEWVADCWNNSYREAPNDGSAQYNGECERRLSRGGSWLNAAAFLRSADRGRNDSVDKSDTLGFRIATGLSR